MMTWFSTGRLRATAIAVVCAVGLSGCAAGGGAYDSSLSPAQNQLRQANQRFTQTVGEGAVAGAVLGGIAGLALGGRNRGQAALIGATAGGALGAGAGYLVARNNLSRSSTEAQFNDAIQQASAESKNYRSYAAAASQVADEAAAEAQRLRGQYQARQITQEQYRAGLAKYRADNDIIANQANTAQQTAAGMRQDSRIASGSNGMQLSSTANEIEASQRQLEQSRARLSRVLDGAV